MLTGSHTLLVKDNHRHAAQLLKVPLASIDIGTQQAMWLLPTITSCFLKLIAVSFVAQKWFALY